LQLIDALLHVRSRKVTLALTINPPVMRDQWLRAILFSRNEVGQRPAVELVTLALPRPALGTIDHGYGNFTTFAEPIHNLHHSSRS
jgi:hypothetical protein